MYLQTKHIPVFAVLILGATGWAAPGKKKGTNNPRTEEITRPSIWTQRDIPNLDLVYGSGGKDRQPGHTFTFVKEDLDGTNPKFVVRDENGFKWKVKLGNESQPEIAAARLVWAVGYYTDDDYLLHVMQIPGLHNDITRGRDQVHMDDSVWNVRLKRENDRKKLGTWGWKDNPFHDTQELDGLRVMMALVDNWDLKKENNAIVDRDGVQQYEISDLGATFGSTGILAKPGHGKGEFSTYSQAKFITDAKPDHVSFGTPSLPSAPFLFDMPEYVRRADMTWIGKDIPRDHVRWVTALLSQLTDAQIRDAFRAAGYTDQDAAAFSAVVEQRIRELQQL